MLSLRCMMQWLILLWFAETQKFIIRHSGGWTADGQWPWLWHSAHCPTTPAIPQLWCQSPVILFTLYSNLFCFLTLHLAVNTNNLIKTYWIHKIDYVYLNDFLLLNVVESIKWFKYMFSFWNMEGCGIRNPSSETKTICTAQGQKGIRRYVWTEESQMDETFRISVDEQDEGKGEEKQDKVEIRLYIKVQILS